MKWILPWMLLSVRLLIVPIFFVAPCSLSDRTVLWLYLLAFVTDYFDGVLARRLHTATPALRKADSAADTIFHLALAYLLFAHHSEMFVQNAIALTAYLITAAAWYLLDAIRWHRVAGFHTYSAKLFSTLLLVWIVLLLSGHPTRFLFGSILILGSLSNLEGIAISLKLKKDRTDVPSLMSLRS